MAIMISHPVKKGGPVHAVRQQHYEKSVHREEGTKLVGMNSEYATC
jgi:hypothetical protein